MTITLTRAGMVALLVGFALTGIGLVYQAWWTLAFAIGGMATAVFVGRSPGGARAIVAGLSVTGAVLLAGMSVFAFYGSGWGGPPWAVAGIACVVTSILLFVFARRLTHTAGGEPHNPAA